MSEILLRRSSVGYVLGGVILMLSLAVGGCTDQSPRLIPPFSAHLNPSEANGQVEREFSIKEPALYAFCVAFKYREGDAAGRSSALKLAGSLRRDVTNRPVTQGAKFSLRITVFKTDHGASSQLFERDINVEEVPVSSWGADAFYKEIAALRLDRGNYQLRVDTLRATPETKDFPIDFITQIAYRGK